jgi:hypothetical protein
MLYRMEWHDHGEPQDPILSPHKLKHSPGRITILVTSDAVGYCTGTKSKNELPGATMLNFEIPKSFRFAEVLVNNSAQLGYFLCLVCKFRKNVIFGPILLLKSIKL